MLETLEATRIVTTPAALDAAEWPDGAIVMRTAADEALVIGGETPHIDDPHAIVVPDGGWMGLWLDAASVDALLDLTCEWQRPATRPAFAQGMVAHLAVKLWFEDDRVLFVVPRPLAHELVDRLPLEAEG